MRSGFLVAAALAFFAIPLVLALFADRAERRQVYTRPPAWAGGLTGLRSHRDARWWLANDRAER